MPISEKMVEKAREEKLEVEEFLRKLKDSKEPYYSAKEIRDLLKPRHLSVGDIENHLIDLCVGITPSIRREKVGGECYYKKDKFF